MLHASGAAFASPFKGRVPEPRSGALDQPMLK
jgi:hypothetical protein